MAKKPGRPCTNRPRVRMHGFSLTDQANEWLSKLAAKETRHNRSAWIEKAIREAFRIENPILYSAAVRREAAQLPPRRRDPYVMVIKEGDPDFVPELQPKPTPE